MPISSFSINGKIYSVDLLFYLLKDGLIPSKTVPFHKFKKFLGGKVWGNPVNWKERFSPKDVLNHPKKYPSHYRRIKKADLRYAILVSESLKILDGYHRLTKAYLLKKKKIKVKILKRKLLEGVKLAEDTKEGWDQVDRLQKKDLRKIYQARKPELLVLIKKLYS